MNVPAVIRRDVAHDREAQSRPPGTPVASPVYPIEALEDAIEVFRRDADAVVGDDHVDRRVVDLRRKVDRRAWVAVLDGVVNEVDDSGHELITIPLDPRAGGVLGDLKPYSMALCLSECSIVRAGQELGDSDQLAVVRLVRLDSAEVEKIFDERARPLRLCRDPLRQPADDVGVVLLLERLGEKTEGADRRAKLVVHVCDEVPPDRIEAAPLTGIDHDSDDTAAHERRGEDVNDPSW